MCQINSERSAILSHINLDDLNEALRFLQNIFELNHKYLAKQFLVDIQVYRSWYLEWTF